MFFGCAPALICLEYTGGWKATEGKVIASDVWQEGHYSCYHLRLCISSHLVYCEKRISSKKEKKEKVLDTGLNAFFYYYYLFLKHEFYGDAVEV